jgi:hypothetical protein
MGEVQYHGTSLPESGDIYSCWLHQEIFIFTRYKCLTSPASDFMSLAVDVNIPKKEDFNDKPFLGRMWWYRI